ncbi:PPE family protein [Mycobacterium sp. HUMS_1102779]|uniref:PPE family protein n=1 Tax=Mycobacterium sp. HUMS_1102779 TaxID=3383487 RepID=UPI003899E6C7
MLDFAQLPPEINSALMYSGPGSGPMLAAAAAWQGLATELHTTAFSYGSLITGLVDGPWQGPAATSMAAAAAPQVAWLAGTGEQAEQVAGQAVAAVAAYEAAFAATVPPPAIVANRALLTALLATNFLGQNTAAIAATEALYAEMWAQDAAAMYGYAGASAAASRLTPFTVPASAVDPAGLAGQAAAVAQALNGVVDTQAMAQIPRALSALAGITNEPPWLSNPAAALGLTGHLWNENGDGIVFGGMVGDVVQGVTGSAEVDAGILMDTFNKWVSPARLAVTQFKDYIGLAHDLPKFAQDGLKAVAGAATQVPAALPSAGLGGIAGAVGKAASVGGLSVPTSWAGAAPAATPVTLALNGFGAGAGAGPATQAVGGLPLMGGGAGRGLSPHFLAPRYGFKPTVMPAPPAGG